MVENSPISILVSSIKFVCWESIWHAEIERKEFFCVDINIDLLANSFDNCVDTCLSFVSVTFVDVWDFDVDPLENLSRRRRRSWWK